MNRTWQRSIIFLSTLFVVGYGIAYTSCSALVETAIETIASACQDINRNQVCYGNTSLEVTSQSDAPNFTFEEVGDITDVTYLRSLKLAPLDELQGVWGMAMMRMQADIPETLPGQNVTFLVFGDVELENTARPEQSPMQSFYLRTGVGAAACLDVPDSGLLIQTPDGVESVQFNINGVDIEIGSTIMLQASPEQHLVIQTLEGAAVVTMGGQSYPVIAGTEMRIPVDAQSQPMGLPSMPTSFSETAIEDLPIAPLPREIPPPTPLPDAIEMKLQMRLEEGLEPCGIPGLPACEHALKPDTKRKWAKKDGYAQLETPVDISLETDIIPVTSDVQAIPVTGGPAILGDAVHPDLIETSDNIVELVVPVIDTASQHVLPVELPGIKDKEKDKDKKKNK